MSGYRDNPRAIKDPDEERARAVVESALTPGETIVWANRPKRGLIYERNPNAFFYFAWVIFSLAWTFSGFITSVSFGIALLGVPFVLFGLNGLFGRYVGDAWTRSHLFYGLTNRRLLILNESRVVAAMGLDNLRTHLITKQDGVGHIRVVSPRHELRGIPNAHEVHRLLLEAQATAPVSTTPESAPMSAPVSSSVPESAAPESSSRTFNA